VETALTLISAKLQNPAMMHRALLEKNMIQNVGAVDRVIRIIAGVALIAATLLGLIGAWGWLGVVVLATGLFRICPAYLPFSFSTCPAKTPTAKP
jgi:hypothetical protein